MDYEELSIDVLGLSNRSVNVLKRRIKCRTIGDFLKLPDEEELLKVRNLGKKSVEEILAMKQQILAGDYNFDAAHNPPPALSACSDDAHAAITAYLAEHDESIEEWKLSAHLTNVLHKGGYTKISQVFFVPNDKLMAIHGMGTGALVEWERQKTKFLQQHIDDFGLNAADEAPDDPEPTPDPEPVPPPAKEAGSRMDRILDYVRAHDEDLLRWGLSVRLSNCMAKGGYHWLSEVFFLDVKTLLSIKNMGRTSLAELESRKAEYLRLHDAGIQKWLNDSGSGPLDEEALLSDVRRLFSKAAFRGYTLQEIAAGVSVTECPELKHVIGRMLAAKELEYVDFRCYRVYPRFLNFVEHEKNDGNRNAEAVWDRLHQKTLQEIGDQYDLTRERIRQLTKAYVRKAKKSIQSKYGIDYFDEDYYRYLFTEYEVEKDAFPWLGIDDAVWVYLDILNHPGKRSLTEAVSDEKLAPAICQRIQNYLNRDSLDIDGTLVEMKRPALEDYVLTHFCREKTTMAGFAEIYNHTLKAYHCPDALLLLTPKLVHSRNNRIASHNNVLWNWGQAFRYYDIPAGDYTALLDALALDSYQDIEVSSLKLFEDNPELMEEYDIRDHYELHNLLRKIRAGGSSADYKKMPIISFGSPDMPRKVRELLFACAPITVTDFAELLHREFGYDPVGINASPLLAPLRIYNNNGTYIVDMKRMPQDRMERFHQALPEDFYYYDEMQAIFRDLFPAEDPDEINSYNLKRMGFLPLSRYAVQHYDSLDQYFRTLLLKSDTQDITPLRKRFAYIQMFSQTLSDLHKAYALVEFEPNQVITGDHLAAQGVTAADMRAYCDEVFDYVEDNTYFTTASLRQDGFSAALEEYDLGDWFYASVLTADSRFSFCKCMGTILLYKGKTYITIQSFLSALISQYGSIDRLDLLNELEERYGCTGADATDLLQKIDRDQIYYDPILQRFYADKELYYEEVGL